MLSASVAKRSRAAAARLWNLGRAERSGYPVIAGPAVVRLVWQFFNDPLLALGRAHAAFGPIVAVGSPLPFIDVHRPFILTAGAEFNRAALSDTETWRPWHIFCRGPRNSAMERLGTGIIRMTDRRHAHYRQLLTQPLRKRTVGVLGGQMSGVMKEEVGSWPIEQPIDLSDRARTLMRSIALALLFGNDRQRGHDITDGLGRLVKCNWSARVFACPINLPITPYGRMLRDAEAIERDILDWADCKRGRKDDRDLLSVVVNNPDEDGNPPTDAIIAGHVPTLFGASFETCQSVLTWTLVLLAQHPRVARDLLDELTNGLAGEPPTLEKISELPFLEAVIKESMRLLPPVPIQIREARQEASLAGFTVPKGARVVLNAFLTNRIPDLYPEPDSFRPERWATINPSQFEYSAFSAGPRRCPGFQFGMSAAKMALAEILTRFRIALVPNARIDYKVRIAMIPRAPVPMVLHRQDGKFAAVPIRGAIPGLVRLPAG
jgi:cytochrome P450